MSQATAAELDYRLQPDNTDLDHIPGEYGVIPYLGKTIQLVNDLYGLLDDCYKRYGEVSKIKVGGQVGLLVMGADNYQQIYLDRDKVFSTMMGYENSLGHFYRGGLLLRDWDDHKVQRRMFQSAFKNDAMRGYIDIMNPLMKTNMDSWLGKPNFLFFPAIKRTLLDVGATVFIGVEELGPEMDEMNEAFLNVSEKGLMGLFKIDFPGFKFHLGIKGRDYLNDYFKRIIPQRRAANGKDMLSYVCREKTEDGNFWSDEDIVPQASFLLFAAHDTTTSALCHMIYHTAKQPEWQERLREESRALGKPYLEYEDIDKMEGLELVFKECLRLHPSVSMMTRRTTKECEIGGHRVPANTMLFIPVGYNHRMPQFWKNPEQFDPERFAPPREEHKSHSFAYVPFGGGAHKCIGMHFANMTAKCFMHQFLLNYRWSVPANYNPKMEHFPLPKPGDNLPLKIEAIA